MSWATQQQQQQQPSAQAKGQSSYFEVKDLYQSNQNQQPGQQQQSQAGQVAQAAQQPGGSSQNIQIVKKPQQRIHKPALSQVPAKDSSGKVEPSKGHHQATHSMQMPVRPSSSNKQGRQAHQFLHSHNQHQLQGLKQGVLDHSLNKGDMRAEMAKSTNSRQGSRQATSAIPQRPPSGSLQQHMPSQYPGASQGQLPIAHQ